MGLQKDRIIGRVLEEETEYLIAIGAAVAVNCIPCFEHLYEQAITAGVSSAEIKRASDIAVQVKKGAHTVISSTIEELTGSKESLDLADNQAVNKSCCG